MERGFLEHGWNGFKDEHRFYLERGFIKIVMIKIFSSVHLFNQCSIHLFGTRMERI